MREENEPNDRKLVLLIDHDVEARRHTRRLLESQGMEVVQASNGIAGLELIQRLPHSFRLVVTDLDLPGLSGIVILETLRLFRPDLPVLCTSGANVSVGTGPVKGCLSKPVQGAELEGQVQAALAPEASSWQPPISGGISDDAVARARARFAVVGDLLEAALEVARGLDPEA